MNHANATGHLAHLYWLTGDNDKAENISSQELENLKNFPLDEMKASLLNGQAISSYDRGAYPEALALIEEALSKRPEDGVLWVNHGIVCRAAGQSKKSLASIKKAIRIKPTSPEFQGSMGYVYMSMGKFDAAGLSFEKALSITPENIPFRLALVFCFSQLGLFDRLEELMKSISAGVQDENSYFTICHTYLQGHKSAALNQLKQMLQAEKIPKSLPARDPSLHFILGIDALLSIT
jgi:tetratricopeptide (TPR) repeat protein